jgi:hypothetical protein
MISRLQAIRRPRFRIGKPNYMLCVGKFRSVRSARSPLRAPGQRLDRTIVAQKRQNHHHGVRTRFEALRARQRLGGNEVAAA